MPVVCCQTTDKTLLSLRIEDRLIPFSLQLSLSASFFLSHSFILFLPSPFGIYFCGPFYDSYSIAQYVILTSYHVTVHRVKFLIIKPTRCTDFSNLFLEWKTTYFVEFLCPSSGVFHCTHSNDICHTGLLTVCQLSAASKPVWHITLLCTGKNSWWWTQELYETCSFYFKNKFEKLVHLVGFIIRNF